MVIKRFIPVFAAIILLLSSCKAANDPSLAATSENHSEVETMNLTEVISKTETVILRDPAKGMYQNDREIVLTNEERSSVLKALGQAQERTQPIFSYFLYSIELSDRDGKVLAVFPVDTKNSVETPDGELLSKEGELGRVLAEIEEKYQIRADLFKRMPGENYFCFMPEVSFGTFIEITENNFIQGLDIRLSRDDIAEMTAALADVKFAAERTESFDQKYQIDLYSEREGLFYCFYIDHEGRVYSVEQYEIFSSGLNEWLNTMIQKNS